jgi:hypothetical protein
MARWSCWARLAATLISVLAATSLWSADTPGTPLTTATLIDPAGKEISLTGVKILTGGRRLAWLADPKAGVTEEARKGPLALEVREPNSTTYQKGVLTLIPAGSVESVRYEYDKQIMTVMVKGAAEPVPGTLHFRGINVVGLEGASGGVVGKFTGGSPKDGFKAVTFPTARPVPSPSSGGITWGIQIDQPKGGNPTLSVRNLRALYAFPGGVEMLVDSLPVRKGDPLSLDAKLKKLEVLAVDTNTHMAAVEVTADGGPDRLVVLHLTREQAGRTGTLVGLVGEVAVGWKLFPMHTIKTLAPVVEKP